MPEAVCNTSPLQYLHQAGVIGILPALYGRLLIPQAVAAELDAGHRADIDLPAVGMLDWIEVRQVEAAPCPLPRDIHRGEAEVIALAGSLSGSTLILDDLAARKHARLLGLRVTGTLGVLLRAKTEGLLGAIAPAVQGLEQAGFRLAKETRLEILRLAGEE